MDSLPSALIISNFPIVAGTARRVLGDRYSVSTRSWSAFREQPPRHADVVVVDVTSAECPAVLEVLSHVLPMAQVVVCSLHDNEVRVYRQTRNGPQIEAALPSLLALSA